MTRDYTWSEVQGARDDLDHYCRTTMRDKLSATRVKDEGEVMDDLRQAVVDAAIAWYDKGQSHLSGESTYNEYFVASDALETAVRKLKEATT